MATLDEACQSHPHTWWWLKGDGCDISSGIHDHNWKGDVDLADGTLESLFTDYINRCINTCQTQEAIINDCSKLEEEMKTDLVFIREIIKIIITLY